MSEHGYASTVTIYIQNSDYLQYYVLCAQWVLVITPDSPSCLPGCPMRVLSPLLFLINSLSCSPLGGPGPPPFPSPGLIPFPSGSMQPPAPLSAAVSMSVSVTAPASVSNVHVCVLVPVHVRVHVLFMFMCEFCHAYSNRLG